MYDALKSHGWKPKGGGRQFGHPDHPDHPDHVILTSTAGYRHYQQHAASPGKPTLHGEGKPHEMGPHLAKFHGTTKSLRLQKGDAMNSSIYITRDRDGNVTVIPNPADTLRKSGPGGRTIAVPVVDLVQTGRDEMSATEKFLHGGTFQAMLPRPVTMLTDESTLRAIREGMMRKSVEAAAELDAGRGRLADILSLFPEATLKGGGSLAEFDEDGNVVGEQPLQKAVDRTMFGPEVDLGVYNGQLLRKGGAADLVRLVYGEYAGDPTVGKTDLKKAAAELDELVDRIGGGR